jgi:hypothetical protein
VEPDHEAGEEALAGRDGEGARFELAIRGFGTTIQELRGFERDRRSRSPRPLADARVWIDTYRTFWEERLDALEAHLRRGGARDRGRGADPRRAAARRSIEEVFDAFTDAGRLETR